MILKVSTARNVPVLMIDSTDHVTGKASLTLTITASKDGGAFAAITPTVTDLGSGWYNLALTTTHTNTLGALALHITSAGADPTDQLHEVDPDLPGSATVTGGVNVTQWNGTNVLTPDTAGAPKVTIKSGSGTGEVSLASGAVTVGTNNDKTGYGLSAAAVQAIWDALTSALTTVGSIGKLLVTNIDAAISSRSTFAGGAVASVTGNVGGNVVGSVGSVTAGVTVTTNNDKTGYALTTADKQSIADTTLQRASSNWEAGADKKSLGAAVMDAVHDIKDDGAGHMITTKSDGVTEHHRRAITTDAALNPIRELGGSS